MLSPSRLFFGTPDPEPPDEKPVWSGSVFNLLEDSDAEEQTDVPAEPSREASLNESEEERRSPGTGGASNGRPAPGLDLPDHPPPGLPLIVMDGFRSPNLVQPAPGRAPHAKDEGTSAEEDADDERSHPGEQSEPRSTAVASNGAPEQAVPMGTVDAGGLWYSELPSIGSANHFSGTCDRCCFHPKGRCLNGFNCQHCHFDHEKRKRKNKKKSKAKQPSALCDDATEMLSTSAEGSLPVSPDRPFGPSMLPPAEFRPAPPTTAPQEHPGGFPQAQPQPTRFPGAQAPRSEDHVLGAGLSGGAAAWLPPQAAPTMCTGASPPPRAQEPPSYQDGYTTAAPTHFDFLSQLPSDACQAMPAGADAVNAGYPQPLEMEARYPLDHDRQEEYIRHLEAENRYLRACLAQCVGPGAAAASLPPMATRHGPFFRPPESMALLPPEAVEAASGPMSFGAMASLPPPPPGVMAPAAPPGAALPPPPPPPTGAATQQLSPTAAPFWPVGQVWHDQADLGSHGYEATSAMSCAVDQGPCSLLSLHHQDADGAAAGNHAEPLHPPTDS